MNNARDNLGIDSNEYKLFKSKLNVRNLRKNPDKLKDDVYKEICNQLEPYNT